LPDQLHPAPPNPPPREITRARDRQRQQKVEQGRPPEMRGIAGDQIAQLGTKALHAERKHRPACDLQGEGLHCLQKIQGMLGGGREFGDNGIRGAGHMTRQKRDRARRKGGGKGSPLIFPLLAFAEQQPVAEQWTQHAKGSGGAAVIVRVLDQDAVNPLGPVENDLLTAEKAANDRIFFKGLRRECQKGVLPQRLGDVPPGQPSGPRASRRTENWLHLAHRPYPQIAEPMPQRSGSSRLVPSAALSPT
jgi:hypothetical protein